MRTLASFVLGLLLGVLVMALSGCATAPAHARVIDWYTSADPIERCLHPHAEDPQPQRVILMPGGCIWQLNELQCGIISSSVDTSYSELGAMARACLTVAR